MSDVSITVFTPTYNRAHLLGRAYESLCGQTAPPPFEWVVVDDGSTDETAALVRAWADTAPFPVRYVRQPNGGKHTAINRGVGEATGELFLILDSDDWLAPDALATVWRQWTQIPSEARDDFAGVGGHFAYSTAGRVGSPFPAPVFDADVFELREQRRVEGDKLEAYRTDVLTAFPFPPALDAPTGGRAAFVTERLVWNRIAVQYKVRYVDRIIGYKEYQSGGLSARSAQLRARAPRTARLYYGELLRVDRPLPTRAVARTAANHARFSLHAGLRPWAGRPVKSGRWRQFVYAVSFPLGVALYLRDRRVLRRAA